MAGAGKKTFTAGETLTASDMNNYVADQVVMYFAGTAARASAVPTPSTGMTSYIGVTGTATIPQIETYTGSAWQTPYGLTQVANVTATTAAAVVINNCFSAAYENYIIVGNLSAASTGIRVNAQMSVGGSISATGYYFAYAGISSTGSAINSFANDDTKLPTCESVALEPNQSSFILAVHKPFLTRYTTFHAQLSNTNGTTYFSQQGSGLHLANTSYDGIAFGPASGTFSGNIRVYGYRNS